MTNAKRAANTAELPLPDLGRSAGGDAVSAEAPHVPTWLDEMSDQYMRGYVAGARAARDIPRDLIPLCGRCGQSDRMQPAGVFPTDFGGAVTIAVCLRCGLVAVIPEGERSD